MKLLLSFLTCMMLLTFTSSAFLKSAVPVAKEIKKHKVHVHFEFSLLPNGLIFVIDGDIDFTMDWSTRPPKMHVNSFSGTLCIKGSTMCGAFRAVTFVHTDGDIKSMTYQVNQSSPDILEALNSPKLVEQLKNLLINGN
jgi:hypothetical protein